MNPHDLLHDALGSVRFEQGELAYLAAGSKPEAQVRDRLAWALMKAGFAAAREWDARRDLAFWPGKEPVGHPAAVVELKACHTYDLCAGRRWLAGEVAKDIAKAASLPGEVEVFLVVIVTHVNWEGARPAVAVKYARRADPDEATATVSALLGALGNTSRVSLDSGDAFGVHVDVEAWLCGPVERSRQSADPEPRQMSSSRNTRVVTAGLTAAPTVRSTLVDQLTNGFEIRPNRDGKYFPVYDRGRRIGEVQLLDTGSARLRLLEPNAASVNLFTPTTSNTWKSGYCEVTAETVEGCRRALELAAAV